MGAATEARAIGTIDAALRWGDEWVSAYATLQAHAADLSATVERQADEIFALQTRAVILEAEALLLRYDVAQALGRVYESESV